MTRTTPPRTRGLIAALLSAAIASACSSATRGTARPTSDQPASHTDLTALARARADSARHVYAAADVHFMTAMIGHHTQAITMARWVPSHGTSSSERTLAERIINSQQDEIATMQQWLRDRGLPVPEPNAAAHSMGMMMGRTGQGMLMPGMLTEVQMQQLDQARGAAFDQLFLADMIQHHRGAVSMVQDLFGSYGAAQDDAVFKIASDINVDQTTEIARMERMRATMMLGKSSQ
ncbi:MAG: DUF305 domain-containing protein [Gemmatimonadaceae bacterium]